MTATAHRTEMPYLSPLPMGQITSDPHYGIQLVLDEGYILVEHRVRPTDENVTGNTMHRTQECAGAAVEIAFTRYLRAYDNEEISFLALRDFAAGAAHALRTEQIGNFAFDKLAELEMLYRYSRRG